MFSKVAPSDVSSMAMQDDARVSVTLILPRATFHPQITERDRYFPECQLAN